MTHGSMWSLVNKSILPSARRSESFRYYTREIATSINLSCIASRTPMSPMDMSWYVTFISFIFLYWPVVTSHLWLVCDIVLYSFMYGCLVENTYGSSRQRWHGAYRNHWSTHWRSRTHHQSSVQEG